MNQQFPPGWDEARVLELISYYNTQSEEESIAEAEAAYENSDLAIMQVPRELVLEILELIESYRAKHPT